MTNTTPTLTKEEYNIIQAICKKYSNRSQEIYEDLLSMAYIKVVERYLPVKDTPKIKSPIKFLRAVIGYSCIDQLAVIKNRAKHLDYFFVISSEATFEADFCPTIVPAEPCFSIELGIDFERFVETSELPELDLLVSILQGKTYEEIAKERKITVNGVKQRFFRARTVWKQSEELKALLG